MRYLHWAKRFYNRDFAFVSFDLSGHGQSGGQRGHITSYDQFLDEVESAVSRTSEIYPGVPIILYGHSMGGNIAINYALRRCCMVSLLIATSPWLKLIREPAWPTRMAIKLLNLTAPSLPLPSNIDPNLLSQIPEEVDKYRNDPLIHATTSPRLVYEISNAARYAMEHASLLNLPFLLMHGQADGLTSFEQSMELSTRVKTCSFIPWRGMYHELHHESVADNVFSMIHEWIGGNLE